MIVLQAFFVRSFSGLFLFWKAPERVQIMKKVNRNNGTIDVTTVGGRMIIPELSEPPVRTLGATIPENESHIFR